MLPVGGSDAIAGALFANAAAPFGASRTKAAERALLAADAAGEGRLVAWALLELVEAYLGNRDPARAHIAFARALRHFDRSPGDFDDHDRTILHTQLSWMVSGALAHPSVPLGQIMAALAELGRRHALAGYGPDAVRLQRFIVADHIGDPALAADAFDGWLATTRDEMSGCLACEPTRRATWQLGLGDDEQALAELAPVTTGATSCEHEPELGLATSLLPLVRTGRSEDAGRHHLRGVQLCCDATGPTHPVAVARHIELCARTGNEARGLDLVRTFGALIADPGTPLEALTLLGPVALLLRRLVALGEGRAPLALPGRRETNVQTLATALAHEARQLAAGFDARNGTTAHAERTWAILHAAPVGAVDLADQR
ncbi:MAG: hypothetical protein JWN46_3067 [Acidimicrobiales bacterium]|nr:hypothetical protein [Acidimicrobiales bacterium]